MYRDIQDFETRRNKAALQKRTPFAVCADINYVKSIRIFLFTFPHSFQAYWTMVLIGNILMNMKTCKTEVFNTLHLFYTAKSNAYVYCVHCLKVLC